MFRQVVVWLLIFIVIAALALWVIGGGPRGVYTGITSFSFVSKSSDESGGFRLPWQPVELFPTIDITDALQIVEPQTNSVAGAQAELLSLTEEYERLNREAAAMRDFGTPSPNSGAVFIARDEGGIHATDANTEYLQLQADYRNSAVIDIRGWSLESALTGVRIAIPGAATSFTQGAPNTLGAVALAPGGVAILTSGPSPVGVSFRENACTGYLQQFQPFTPPLAERCPSPASLVPMTEQNLIRYGAECFDVLATLSACRFPNDLPHTLPAACRTELANTLSYNGCVRSQSYRTDFQDNVWRLYLGSSQELWRTSHDVIRLLDAQGRTVDVFTY